MDRFPIKNRRLLSRLFFKLNEKEKIEAVMKLCLKSNDVEVTVRGGINEDFIYGIVLEIYEVELDLPTK